MNTDVDLEELAAVQKMLVLFGIALRSYSTQIESSVADAEGMMKDPPSKKSMDQASQIAGNLRRAGSLLEQNANEELRRTEREIETFESL
jgi:hypothetical protein